VIQTTNIVGNYVQNASGSYALDLDLANLTADLVKITGSASLAGTLAINLIDLGAASGEVTFLTAEGGITYNGLVIESTAVLDFSLLNLDPNSGVLSFKADFTVPTLPSGSLDSNQQAVAENLNAILGAGGGAMGPVLTELASIGDLDAYRRALDRLQGAHYQMQVGATLLAARYLVADRLLACPEELALDAPDPETGRCLWGQVFGRDLEIDRTYENLGGDERVWGFAGGYEGPLPLGEDLRAAVAFAIEDSDVSSDNAASGEGVRVTLGASLERRWEELKARIGAYGGMVSYDSKRVIGLDAAGTAKADQDIRYGGVIGRLSYDLDAGPVRLVPMLDLAATYLSYGDLREHGAGSTNLIIEKESQWVFSATPGVEVKAPVVDTAERRLDATVYAGVSFYADNDFSLQGRFSGAPAQVPSFTTKADYDEIVGTLAVGLELATAQGMSMQLGYDGWYSDNITSHGGYLRLALPF
jgi:uncharacterized protein with beta-barrel porin domain